MLSLTATPSQAGLPPRSFVSLSGSSDGFLTFGLGSCLAVSHDSRIVDLMRLAVGLADTIKA